MGLQVSLDPGSKLMPAISKFSGLKIISEDDNTFKGRIATFIPYNVIELKGARAFEPLLAMHWVSRLFPMGHIKSVNTGDEAFIQKFSKSRKWLSIEGPPSK